MMMMNLFDMKVPLCFNALECSPGNEADNRKVSKSSGALVRNEFIFIMLF